MVAQPVDRRELHGVGDLVQHDPRQQRLELRAHLASRHVEVRADQQQPWRRGRVEEGELVLAQHAPAHQPHEPAHLGRHERPGGRPQRAGDGRRRETLQALQQGSERRAHRRQVRPRPGAALDRLGRRERPLRREPAVRDDGVERAVGELREVAGKRVGGDAFALADGVGDPFCEGPVDHQLGSVPSSASARAVRAATTGE